MKFSAAILFISCLTSLMFAQRALNAGVSIVNPVLNSTAYAGSNYAITWTVLDANATTIEAISLMNGSASNLNFVFTNILTNGSIPVTDLSYNWTIPCNLTSGQDYAIARRGNNSYMTYSSYFTIISNVTNCTSATNATTNTTDATVQL